MIGFHGEKLYRFNSRNHQTNSTNSSLSTVGRTASIMHKVYRYLYVCIMNMSLVNKQLQLKISDRNETYYDTKNGKIIYLDILRSLVHAVSIII